MNLMRDWKMVEGESTDSDGIFPVLRMAFRKCDTGDAEVIYYPGDEKQIKRSLVKWAPRQKECTRRSRC